VFLVLFSINFVWISFAGVQAVLGFLLLMKQDVFGARNIHDKPPGIRTAVLAPVYNEDPLRVAAGIRAMSTELAQQAPGCFAFFILSDTTNPTAWLREEHTFKKLIEQASPDCPIYYRHRRKNSERKAGNISDWVMRWGGGYEAMLVLDADSIMSGSIMVLTMMPNSNFLP
jgi:membrane glycosyltransferase